MARARNIKPGFFTNDELVELPMATRLLFIGLWTLADREGRLEDRPRKIKMEIFPADEIDVDEALSTLVSSGFIHRYPMGEGRFIQVIHFAKHQRPHSNEAKSTIPPPNVDGKPETPEGARHSVKTAQTAHHDEQHGEPGSHALRPDSFNPDTGFSDTGSIDDHTAGAGRLVPPVADPQPERSRPRSDKQQASDAAFERRVALYGAWCAGVGIDPNSEEARVGRDIAFRHLRSIVTKPVPTPEEFGACTRYLASQSWRDDPPSIPQVIQGYGRWVGQGRPKRASPRPMPTSRASPRRGAMTPEEIAAYALELEAQGR
jgi:hypothetical protein